MVVERQSERSPQGLKQEALIYQLVRRHSLAAKRVFVTIAILCLLGMQAQAYSVLTHEEIVDLAWEQYLKPALLEKYPATTADQLNQAHAYAYGGCLIQDMGYYPFGNKHFSDLVHYVRSGDFILNLLKDAQDVNEYAFALGALSHYAADMRGHPAVNRAVPMEFWRLHRKYGNLVTYEQDPKAHIRIEFGFDVAQVAKRRYAPQAYHDFIGFQVSQQLLARAFQETYGIELNQLFSSIDLAIGNYRHAVSTTIPKLTQVALLTKNNMNVPEAHDRARRKFLYHLSRADYEKEWGKQYQRPNASLRFLAFVFRLIPKVGPLKAIDFKVPSTATEDLYVKSVNDTVDLYDEELREAKAGNLSVPNMNFDNGLRTLPGQYKLADRAYAKLVDQLSQRQFRGLTPVLKDDIVTFYSDPHAPIDTRKNTKKWKRLERELAELKNISPPENATATTAANHESRD